MNSFEPIKHKMSFFASCPQTLEQLLLDEINAIEVKSTNIVRGGVEFEAYNEKVLEIILNSRIASRVFKKYYTFYITNEHEFSSGLRQIKWKGIFSSRLTFKVMSHVSGDSRDLPRAFQNTLYLSQLVKDGIVDHFRKEENTRPNVDTKNPEVTIYAHLTPERNEKGPAIRVDILADLCGEPISDRGLRPLGRHADAPLRENLAAALITYANWDPSTERFVDLMCGSGTILAEAYLMAKKIPPSFLRVKLYDDTKDNIWAFQNLLWFQKDDYLVKNFEASVENVLTLSESVFGAPTASSLNMLGLDNDQRAIWGTEDLVKKIQADSEIELQRFDATTYVPAGPNELLFCNPPYGLRLESQNDQLGDLYYNLGEQWKNESKGCRAFIFTANLPLLKHVALRPKNKWNMFNGQLPARLVEYALY